MKLVQDEISGARDARKLVIQDALEQRRERAKQSLQDRKEAQEWARLRARERGRNARLARQLEAQAGLAVKKLKAQQEGKRLDREQRKKIKIFSSLMNAAATAVRQGESKIARQMIDAARPIGEDLGLELDLFGGGSKFQDFEAARRKYLSGKK